MELRAMAEPPNIKSARSMKAADETMRAYFDEIQRVNARYPVKKPEWCSTEFWENESLSCRTCGHLLSTHNGKADDQSCTHPTAPELEVGLWITWAMLLLDASLQRTFGQHLYWAGFRRLHHAMHLQLREHKHELRAAAGLNDEDEDEDEDMDD
jgi:hypothetical protein